MHPRRRTTKLNTGLTESERLKILRSFEVLDTPAEEAFDHITRVAARIAGVPIALVTLVDESRQWFKSRVGLEVEETPREYAFCSHAIQSSQLMVISDTRTDDRFQDNPFVVGEPGIRFYAGVPLVSPEGAGLGTLCVIDREPRELTPDQVELLYLLGQHVQAELNLRRAAAVQRVEHAALVKSNALLETIADNAPVMFFVKHADTLEVAFWNKTAEEISGVSRDAILGKTGYESFPAAQMDAFQRRDRKVLDEGKLIAVEETLTGPTGSRILHTKKVPVCDEDGVPQFLVGISQDITERKRDAVALQRARDELEMRVQQRTAELTRSNQQLVAEIEERKEAEAALQERDQQLRQSQKMEAIGQLAGGVAHDFNNLLSVILGCGDFVLKDMPADNPFRTDVAAMYEAGLKAADLTRQLLAFSRQQVLKPRVISLRDVLFGLEKILRRLIGEHIELRASVSDDVADVEVDPSQIEQVILNLAVNARDAMPGGGTLTLSLRNLTEAEVAAAGPPSASLSPSVLLSVKDTGMGMDEQTRTRAFEPFFTTKEAGQGTGLGLSTVLGIVEQSGGKIWIDSEPGRGSSVHVLIPQAPEHRHRHHQGPPTPAAEVGGGETILLVEDEPQVRDVVQRILAEAGYNVVVAASPGDALLRCEQNRDAIHLVLSDVVMPLMCGPELCQRLTALRPETRILLMSGHATDDATQPNAMPLLRKPVTQRPLLEAVRQVLDEEHQNAQISGSP